MAKVDWEGGGADSLAAAFIGASIASGSDGAMGIFEEVEWRTTVEQSVFPSEIPARAYRYRPIASYH